MYDTILKAGKESQSTYASSCYASLYSVIPYIFLRPIHGNVGNDNDVTSFTDDKHFGLNGLRQRGLEGIRETERTKLQVLPHVPFVGVLFVSSVQQ